MSKTDFHKLNKEFLDATIEHCVKWCDKHGYPASLICSVSIHEPIDPPKDVGLVEPHEKSHMLYTNTIEFELEGIKNFPTHARSVLKALDKYSDEMEDDS